jgi:2-phosphosulfolactate phosphatase
MNTVEICLVPELYPHRKTKGKHVAVIVDVLRATTTIAVALEQGAKKVIPVTDLNDLPRFKKDGCLIVSERDGLQSDIADFGNSPLQLIANDIQDKVIAISTTNGTRAIAIANDADAIYLGAFANLSALVDKLKQIQQDIVIVCSGWKYRFSLEDMLFAGVFCEKLTSNNQFSFDDDSVLASMDLWKAAKNNLLDYVSKSEHYKRLYTLSMGESIPYCFELDTCTAVPVLEGGIITNAS